MSIRKNVIKFSKLIFFFLLQKFEMKQYDIKTHRRKSFEKISITSKTCRHNLFQIQYNLFISPWNKNYFFISIPNENKIVEVETKNFNTKENLIIMNPTDSQSLLYICDKFFFNCEKKCSKESFVEYIFLTHSFIAKRKVKEKKIKSSLTLPIATMH